MKLRHAAALALVGWYLMAPPPVGHAKDFLSGSSIPEGFATDAPLSAWWRIGYVFDSVAACKEARVGYVKKLKTDSGIRPSRELDKERQQMSASQCIATDDPRLKEN